MVKKQIPLPKMSQSDISRFWQYVEKGKDSECWRWAHRKNKKDYGIFQVGGRIGYGKNKGKYNGKRFYSHRISYLLHHKKDPVDFLVLHHCDNPQCVNPHHLFLGDDMVNCQDKLSKGRQAKLKGEDHGMAKLTEEDVKQIFLRYKQGGVIYKDLANEYGVSISRIGFILTGRSWSHVTSKL